MLALRSHAERGDEFLRLGLDKVLESLGESSLARSLSHDVDHATAVDEIHASSSDLRALRVESEGEFARSGESRTPDFLGRWSNALTEIIELTQQLRTTTRYQPRKAFRVIGALQDLKHSVWVMSEFAERERAIIAGTIAADEPLTLGDVEKLSSYRGQLLRAWSTVQVRGTERGASPQVVDAVSKVRREFFNSFEKMRAPIIESGIVGAAYPMSTDAWMAQSALAIDSIRELGNIVGQVSRQRTRSTEAHGLRRLVYDTAVFIITIVLAVASVWIVLARIVRPLERVTLAMSAIASGDQNVAVPSTARRDEIGAMIRAVETFKEHAEERAREISRTNEELRQLNESLEDRVQRRTADLETALDDAEAANRAKGAFLANMSHEIRTPMNAIVGMTRLALQTELSGKQRDYLSKARVASDSLLAIIDDILDFSKIEAGKLEIEWAAFDLEEVMDHLATIMGLKAGEKGLELVFSIDPEVPRALVGDALRLGQVLINLTSNSVKFTDRGEVVVSARIHDRDDRDDRDDREYRGDRRGDGHRERDDGGVWLTFSVSDTGVGLTSDQRERLFQAFTQADESITRKYGGTGLGLAICKQLVGMMDGQIWAESIYGEGTTVSFSARFGVHAGGPTREIPQAVRGMPVLVVDDSAVSRSILSRMLTGLEFQVDAVESAEAALTSLSRRARDAGRPQYGVVFMDWKMPGMDGLEATLRIKNEFAMPRVPAVIMVTAFDRDELLAHEDRASLDGVLTKPVNESTLFDKVIEMFSPADVEEARLTVASRSGGANPTPLTGVRVLLVEDNSINQQIAVEILGGAGAVMEIAVNGREAVERLRRIDPSEAFDAVLMDLEMPELDGYQATEIIRSYPALADLPIIAMTAHAMKEQRERCLAVGMNDHVAKPIDPERLLATVVRWVGSGSKILPAAESMPIRGPDGGLPARVPGIELQEGLHRIGGNSTLYAELLSAFSRDHVATAAGIHAAIGEGDIDTAKSLAHAVKGLAGNLSANTLAAAAAELESWLRSGADPDSRGEPLLSAFEAALAEVRASVSALNLRRDDAADSGGAAGGSGLSMDTAGLRAALQDVAQLLSAHDLGAEDRFLAVARRYDLSDCDDEVTELRDHLARLRFEPAQRSVGLILHRLEAPSSAALSRAKLAE